MEDEKTNKHGKKKINTSLGSITIGGEGGITGLLVFGGALALAGFMAVTSFGTRKHKRKAIHPHHHQQILLDDDKDHSLVQYSTTQFGEDVTSCLESNECTKTVSSSELQPLILEEKIDNEPNNACFHPQEVAFSDHSHPESASSSNENGVTEECPELLLNNSCDREQEEEKDELQDGLTTTETDDDDDVDDDVMETDEEDSSIATGTTSLDEKEELIEQEYKKYYCENNLCSEEMTVQKEAILNKTANLSVVQNDQPSIFRTWVMPMLMLGFLMILAVLTRGLQESLYVLDDGML
ncbi:hypothetical protein P8452_62888 [Trifolium repens]|nr:hypothetical protein P8452_62888 [Trifolium repens]